MSMEEDNDKPTDLNDIAQDIDNLNLESDDDSQEEKAFIEFKNNLHEEYKVRTFYVDLINETSTRGVNGAMTLTQLFGRYSNIQTIVFLGVALIIVVIQVVCAQFAIFPNVIIFLGLLMNALMFYFVFTAVNYFISALYDLRLLKRGFCSVGYQIIRSEVAEKTPDDSYPKIITVAYLDSIGMIRTKDVPTEQHRMFFLAPVLIVMVDKKNPYRIAIIDIMPRDIQYDKDTRRFTQEWKNALFALVPIAMTILYAISLNLFLFADMAINK